MFRSLCGVSVLLAAAMSLASSEPRQAEPFRVFVFTHPRGAKAAEERMRLAVDDVEEVVELSDWVDLVDDRETAEIVVEIKAYALADDASVHLIYAEVEVLGEAMMIVGSDEHEHASRKRAVSDLMEQLRDYCADHFARLDAERRGS